MKKKYIAALAVLLAIAVVAGLYLWWSRTTTLGELYPALKTGEYHNASFEQTYISCGVGSHGSALSDGELQGILSAARVTKRDKFREEHPEHFYTHLTENGVTYSIVIGNDDSITVAQLDDLDGTRTYWTDITGKLFSTLYDLHLKNGGEAFLTDPE